MSPPRGSPAFARAEVVTAAATAAVTALGDAVGAWRARMLGCDDLAPGTRVIVGCSGGTDSLALLALACATGLDAVAVYVDHGLRDTAHDRAVVADAAGRFGIRWEALAVAVGAGANLEARARAARYEVLGRAAARHAAAAILVAHTRDDQAETVLLNLMRGSAAAGLAGMRVQRGLLRRPLLGLRRADTREICARLRLAPVHDPMNDDLRHRRVWLRREIIPHLERGANRDLVEVLARQADLLREDDELLDALARDVVPTGEALHVAAVLALARPLARRAVRAWLGSPPPSLSTVDAVLAVAAGPDRASELPGGRRIERRGGYLHIAPTPRCVGRPSAEGGLPTHQGGGVSVSLPGHARLGALGVHAWVEHAAPVAWPDGRTITVLDADAAGATATLRPATPGERFRPLGGPGSKSVSDALAEVGVAADRRRASPVLAAGDGAAVPSDGVLWVVGYRIDDRVRVTASTRRFLWVAAEPAPDGEVLA